MSVRPSVPSGMGFRLWWRRLRSEPVLVSTMALAVLVAATTIAAIPRVVEHTSEQDLRATIRDAEPERRNIELRFDGRIPAGADPLSVVDERSDVIIDNSMPESIRPILTDELFVVDSPAFVVSSYPDRTIGPFPTTFRFRLQEDIADEWELVAGGMPELREPISELAGADCPTGPEAVDDFVPDDGLDCELVDVPVFETLISRRTATDMDAEVGEQLTLTPNLVDIEWQLAGAGDRRMVLEIAGIVELSDLSSEYWYADNRLHQPRITENADYRLIDASGILLPEQYGPFLAVVTNIDLDYSWRLLVDPDRVDGDDADDLVIDLANLDIPAFEVTTGLPGLVDEHRTQRSIVIALLSTVAVGLGVVAAAVSATLALSWAQRDHDARALVIARGASRRQVSADALRTAAAVVVPATAVGSTIAWLLFRTTSSTTAVLAACSLASGVAVTILWSVLSRGPAPERPIRRIVIEGGMIVAAAGAVTAVRRRGRVGVDGVADLDPLLAVTPTLVVVSLAIVVLRLVAPLARSLARIAERRRGLVAFVGLRQLVARPFTGRITTAVLVVCVAVAVFGASIDASISEGREAASWYEVGGDVTVEARLEGAALPTDVAGLDLDAPAARRTTYPGATARLGRDSSTLDAIAIDAAAYRDVLGGAPIEQPPLGLLIPDDGAIPSAILSRAWQRGRAPDVGDELVVDVGAGPIDLVVAARVETFPATEPDRPFVIVDSSTIGDGLRPTALHVRGDPGTGFDRDAPLVRVLERTDALSAISDDPLSSWTVRILRLVVVLAASFAAVAAVAALAMSVATRSTDTAVLRTLGLDTSRTGAITAVEQVPTLLAATLAGAASGAVAFWSLLPALGLARFAGPGRPIAARVDLSATVMSAASLATTMVIAIAVSTWVQRRTDLAATLRLGDTP